MDDLHFAELTPDWLMQFKTAIAGGKDWRVVARSLMIQIPDLQDYNFAVLYVTDELAEHTNSIFTLLRRLSRIPHWMGGSTLAAFSDQGYLHGEPGAALMVAKLPKGAVLQPDANPEIIKKSGANFGMLHADPRHRNLRRDMAHMANLPVFWTGGMMLNRGGHRALHGTICHGEPLSLTLFKPEVGVATLLMQGCKPFGQTHTVTSAEDNLLYGLDHRPAIEVFAEDLALLAAAGGEVALPKKSEDVHLGLLSGAGDQADYAVRGLASIDPDHAFLTINTPLEIGQKVRFVQRDKVFAHDTMRVKLDQMMMRLKAQKQKPVAAIYVSCMGRVPGLFNEQSGLEMDYLQYNLGKIPVIGYYGIGEIMRGEMHNFAGALTVFTE